MWGLSLVLYVVLSKNRGQKEFAVLRFENYSADIRFLPHLLQLQVSVLTFLQQ